jgi:hypothetical protein
VICFAVSNSGPVIFHHISFLSGLSLIITNFSYDSLRFRRLLSRLCHTAMNYEYGCRLSNQVETKSFASHTDKQNHERGFLVNRPAPVRGGTTDVIGVLCFTTWDLFAGEQISLDRDHLTVIREMVSQRHVPLISASLPPTNFHWNISVYI